MSSPKSTVSNLVSKYAPIDWKSWPRSTPEIEAAMLSVLRSGRWAISGMNVGKESEERRFSSQFAAYLGVACVAPTANGSSALVAALQACGVGYGDEVLVPGLAWVACASAVVRVGAIPVFVDIDPDTYSMDPLNAESLISPRTTAVLVTHLSSSVADLDAFSTLATKRGLVLIEDASQAHGAIWRGKRVGAFGEVAAFSFQSSKLLTAGEGGAVVSRNSELAEDLQQIRADGRVWATTSETGFPDLTPGVGQQGHNFCMTEMQAAILSASLPFLDSQHDVRHSNVLHLESMLSTIDGVRTIRRHNDLRVDRTTYWHLPIQIDPEQFGGASAETVRSFFSRLSGLFLEPVGAPMPEHPLYRPQLYRNFPVEHVSKLTSTQNELPSALHLSKSCFTLPHHALLEDPTKLEELVTRLVALQQALRERRSYDRDC